MWLQFSLPSSRSLTNFDANSRKSSRCVCLFVSSSGYLNMSQKMYVYCAARNRRMLKIPTFIKNTEQPARNINLLLSYLSFDKQTVYDSNNFQLQHITNHRHSPKLRQNMSIKISATQYRIFCPQRILLNIVSHSGNILLFFKACYWSEYIWEYASNSTVPASVTSLNFQLQKWKLKNFSCEQKWIITTIAKTSTRN